MHLKSLEINGFKSFSDRTKLLFEPGMVAIVGPNGCGKSNVSDAIRWVLGEQRPTALRCNKMPDIVFNGTDTRKPLGMAEVSITFADCEGILSTEFNEVTITRRVFRSGEGQYFINKNLCRLRDVHRLFMGTGIGTTSYSVMAQGQIDAILSSKPEDRRAIFEEAAGITKFKADRKEALRKLEQTDANLLRLADVIREVKRQIGSLQRQAGKARRFRELRDELRGLDIFVTRRRLATFDVRIRDLESETIQLAASLAARQTDVANGEKATAAIHEQILQAEHRIGTLTQSAAQADSQLVRAQEVTRVNEQRMAEYREWAERDTREISATRDQITALQTQRTELQARLGELRAQDEAARAALQAAQAQYEEHRLAVEQTRNEVHRLREESVDRERRSAALQNQLTSMETRQREILIQRERLSAEHAQLARGMELVASTRHEVQVQLDLRAQDVSSHESRLQDIEAERTDITAELRTAQDERSRLQAQIAARRAQIDILSDRDESAEEYLEGTRQLLDPANPLQGDKDAVLGSLAEKLTVPQDLRLSVEAALRAWLDAVLVRNAGDARTLVDTLLGQGKKMAARLVVADGAKARAPACPAGLQPLLDAIEIEPEFTAAASRLLGHVFLARTPAEVPLPLPAGCAVVTRNGVVFHANGCVEVWMPDRAVSSPLARRMLIADNATQLTQLEQDLAAIRTRIEERTSRSSALAMALVEARRACDEMRRQAAHKEGELQSVTRDADRARQRLEVVAHELETLNLSTRDDDNRKSAWATELQQLAATRDTLVESIAACSDKLRTLESSFGARNTTLTEARIQTSTVTQQCEHTASQLEAVTVRLSELERTLEGRNQGVQSYDEGIRRLATENADLAGRLGEMQRAAAGFHAQVAEARKARAATARELERAEAELSGHRQTLDACRTRKAAADVELAENRMYRQNQFDRIGSEYSLSPTQLVSEPDPAWPNGQPPAIEDAEARIAELNNAIHEMGPVNLVAIEEYKELEERHAFLHAQEADLVKAKGQVMDLIRMINKKTSEMFQETFTQANGNFERMFGKLFNGGTARLVLMENAEDPLECGIDIIARPPGKRLQSISLLSGGERTMTAVALLFAIFMIKPAPFCMLDELDAALDDSNIGRFVLQLKEFLVHSQFLIITHSQQTIASADIVYGITMPEKGISKVVSMRLKEIGVRELEIEASPETLAAAKNASDAPPPKRSRRRAAATPADDPADQKDQADPSDQTDQTDLIATATPAP
ncbi:MAG: chromosome segregation protein SMC [Kiritimatiellia bacterium]